MRVIEGRRADGERTGLTLILDAIAGRKISARGVGWARHRAHHEIGVARVPRCQRVALELGHVHAGRADGWSRIGLTAYLSRAWSDRDAVDAVRGEVRIDCRGCDEAVEAWEETKGRRGGGRRCGEGDEG